jgi:flagellar hook-length control protein FliK
MPQMISIQPVTPQAPPSGAPGQKGQSSFSPHLENAISSKKSQQQTSQSKNDSKTTSSAAEQKGTADTESQPLDLENQALEGEASEAIETTSGEEPGDNLEHNSASTGLAFLSGQTPQNIPAVSIFLNSHQLEALTNRLQNNATTPTAFTSLQQETISVLAGFQQLESAANLSQNGSSVIDTTANNVNTPTTLAAIQSELSGTTTAAEILNLTKPGLINKQDALLTQLQQIIDSANETGSVSITKATNVFSPNSLRENIHGISNVLTAVPAEEVVASPSTATNNPTFSGLVVAGNEVMEKAAGRPTQNGAGIRQDVQQQYFNAKTTMENIADSNQNLQNNQQGEEFSRQPMSPGVQSSIFTTTDSTNIFSQVAASVQPESTQLVSESPKPILLPSGTIVHEDDVIRQLTERFHITSRNMDSRINIKLHPAELGELKIDLTVKEGAIRANVVAQSQQTVDILEKNIQKLKNMLEQQGYAVEQISLSAQSESVGDFDLFDQQLFGKNDATPSPAKNRMKGDDLFSLEESPPVLPTSDSGVNVKI